MLNLLLKQLPETLPQDARPPSASLKALNPANVTLQTREATLPVKNSAAHGHVIDELRTTPLRGEVEIAETSRER